MRFPHGPTKWKSHLDPTGLLVALHTVIYRALNSLSKDCDCKWTCDVEKEPLWGLLRVCQECYSLAPCCPSKWGAWKFPVHQLKGLCTVNRKSMSMSTSPFRAMAAVHMSGSFYFNTKVTANKFLNKNCSLITSNLDEQSSRQPGFSSWPLPVQPDIFTWNFPKW